MATAKKTEAAISQKLDASQRQMKAVFKDCAWTDVLIPRPPGDLGDDSGEEQGLDYVEAELNGVVYLIRRGETVRIPAPLYIVLKQSRRFGI